MRRLLEAAALGLVWMVMTVLFLLEGRPDQCRVMYREWRGET